MKSTPLILLAAGRSSRMGIPKGLLKFKNIYWLEHQIQNYFSYGGKKVLIVLGDHCSEYQKVFSWLDLPEKWLSFQRGQVAYVQNKNPKDGQFSSLQIALNFLLSKKSSKFHPPPNFEKVLLLPVDVPLADEVSLKKMLTSFKDKSECKVCIPSYQKQKGHPVLLSRIFCQYLVQQQIASNPRLDHIIRGLKTNQVGVVDVNDKSVHLNINTTNDWREYIASTR